VRAELGWQPKYGDIRTIVESAWAWHVKNPKGYGG
jgi:UDP-glucose 4-epimerase